MLTPQSDYGTDPAIYSPIVVNDRHRPTRLIGMEDGFLRPLVDLLEAHGTYRTTERSRPGLAPETQFILSVTHLSEADARWVSWRIGYGSAVSPQGVNRTQWRYVLNGRLIVGEVLIRTLPLMNRSPRRTAARQLLRAAFGTSEVMLCSASRCCRPAPCDERICGWHADYRAWRLIGGRGCALCGKPLDETRSPKVLVFDNFYRYTALCSCCKGLLIRKDESDVVDALQVPPATPVMIRRLQSRRAADQSHPRWRYAGLSLQQTPVRALRNSGSLTAAEIFEEKGARR